MEDKEQWLFYLKLTKNLDKDYLRLSQEFTARDKSLIPITIGNLLECTKKTKTIHLMIVIKSVNEYEYFHKRAKKIIKYLVQAGKVHVYIASSFTPAHNTVIMKKDHYNFMRLPVPYKNLCDGISHMIDAREKKYAKWPGGTKYKRREIEL